MNDFVYHGFREMLLKQERIFKGLTIDVINLETFKVNLVNDGIMDLQSLAYLGKWANDIIRQRAHELDFISNYHKDSSRRCWNKIEKDTEGNYTVGLDLEEFLESSKQQEQMERIEQVGSFIPDNYELAKRVMKEFHSNPDNQKYKLKDISFRETAMWETKNKKAAEALANYIDETYVQPTMQILLKNNKISKVIFTDTQVDFEYE